MIKKYQAQGIEVQIDVSDKRVFSPHPITLLLGNSIKVKPTDKVLDIGSGSGFLSIVAAKLGAKKIIASDISKPAYCLTQKNMTLNNTNGNITAVRGDFFAPFQGRRFNLIISNPPCMPFPNDGFYINSDMRKATDGGEDGSEMLIKLLKDAKKYLEHSGALYMPVSKWSNWRRVIKALDSDYKHETVASGLVRYFLSDDDPCFYDHIMALNKAGLVDLQFKEGLPYAETLIKRVTPIKR